MEKYLQPSKFTISPVENIVEYLWAQVGVIPNVHRGWWDAELFTIYQHGIHKEIKIKPWGAAPNPASFLKKRSKKLKRWFERPDQNKVLIKLFQKFAGFGAAPQGLKKLLPTYANLQLVNQ